MPELAGLLRRSGHGFRAGDAGDPSNVEVQPGRDIYATLALNLDETLRNDYRERYFATLVDDFHGPVIRHDPDFAWPGSFAEATATPPRSYGAFLAGPFRWLVRRLNRFPRVLVWPEEQIRSSDQFMKEGGVLDEMPRLAEWLRREPPIPPDAGALVLDLSDPSDCAVLWEIAEQVERDFYNYYVSDPDGTEVYLLHHHSKITISIPDERTRGALLAELASRPDLLEDCSGYLSDDEDEDSESAAPGGPADADEP